MNLVPTAVSRAVAHRALVTSNASPGLLLGAGIVGMTASTVLACRATLKMHDILEDAQNDIEVANGIRNMDRPDYTEKDMKKDVALIRYKTSVRITRAYAPAIVVGGLSIYCFTSSNRILSRRNAALTAAYAALDKGFREYRGRVVDRYGEKVDQELRYETVEVEVQKADGRTKTVRRVGPNANSIYAKFFDESSPSWNRDPEYNLIFLQCQQNYANDRLKARGHVFLNEVYEALGLPHTEAGAVVGWFDGGNGDNFIDFGIFNGEKEQVRDFVNGYEGAILLDFNVDGVIYDKLGN